MVTIHSPASLSNLLCGFDILGLALDAPYDMIQLAWSDEPGIRLLHDDDFNLPVDPQKNIAGIVLQAIRDKHPQERGWICRIKKGIKPGSGIGSSAASAAGAAVAAHHLLGLPFTHEELIGFAMCGEQVASGGKHADNIAPCIYGGITLVRSLDPLDIIPLAVPDIYVTVVHPQIEVKTSFARSILRPEIPMKDAITQWANVAGLVSGFYRNDPDLIARSLVDVVAEPYRKQLIPGYEEVIRLSREAGALGGGISGSGPSMFMFSQTKSVAADVGAAMKNVYDKLGIENFVYVSGVNTRGAYRVD